MAEREDACDACIVCAVPLSHSVAPSSSVSLTVSVGSVSVLDDAYLDCHSSRSLALYGVEVSVSSAPSGGPLVVIGTATAESAVSVITASNESATLVSVCPWCTG